ncbi:MAG: NAD+ synthase [Rhodocyclaceae bacterium]|jgi:NAD+ synthase/NAD+ synthase (glutamine-hydrolysing)|nr:NAD+ synthase [Rhodocyclaceae bacterium]MCL4756993.1 NAD+ synthase [Rhodocyclaceae bacterium]
MDKTLKIAVAQFNPVVGDLGGNAERIIEALEQARDERVDLLLTPELALSGYPPEDLLLRPDFHRACTREIERIALHAQGVTLVLGHPRECGGRRFNSASVLRDGALRKSYDKRCLPNYAVFDEARYFSPGTSAVVFEMKGVTIGLGICEDLWVPEPARGARAAGAELLLGINASPFHLDKHRRRLDVLRERVAEVGIPLLYCNMVGGQDELVFDGASCALDREGRLAWQAPSFSERIDTIVYRDGRWEGARLATPRSAEEEVYEALKAGVRDYLGKNGFPGAVIGLSGGVDSALTLCIAADALGPERVRAVMMASPYTAQMSLDDSRALVANLGVRYDEIPIEPAMKVFADLLAPQFQGLAPDATEENLQSRIRGMILMALSNKTGWLVLTTGNKSEMATGYATLYGDMAGGFAVLKDLYKTFIYRLSAWRNTVSPVIPENIIARPPSAELKPDQTDQDSLPPYEVLDAIIEAYMERDESPREIIARGYEEADVRRTVSMLKRNEYKRRQAPVGIRVTPRGFGRDWRYPITSRYRDEY